MRAYGAGADPSDSVTPSTSSPSRGALVSVGRRDDVRVCTEPGCPTLIRSGSRCTPHARAKDAARGRRQARGYDRSYDQAHRSYQQRMDVGERFTCWRCAQRGTPHTVDPQDWHLGHCDNDRSVLHGPECPAGNLATSGRTTCTHMSHVT